MNQGGLRMEMELCYSESDLGKNSESAHSFLFLEQKMQLWLFASLDTIRGRKKEKEKENLNKNLQSRNLKTKKKKKHTTFCPLFVFSESEGEEELLRSLYTLLLLFRGKEESWIDPSERLFIVSHGDLKIFFFFCLYRIFQTSFFGTEWSKGRSIEVEGDRILRDPLDVYATKSSLDFLLSGSTSSSRCIIPTMIIMMDLREGTTIMTVHKKFPFYLVETCKFSVRDHQHRLSQVSLLK